MLHRLAIVLVGCLAALTVLAGDAAHAQQICLRLQAELARVSPRGGSGGDRYEQAFREQAAALARTEQQARRAGCMGGGFLFFRGQPSSDCRTFIPKLRQMEANLAKLDRLRRRGSGNGNARRARQITAQMRDLGCAGVPRSARGDAENSETAYAPEMQGVNRGTYRTLCVRTCDGYYFPISFSASRNQFSTDAEQCRSMCPGASAELFYYPNPGAGPENMVSLTGTAYSSLPTAFQYRQSYNPSCSCGSTSANAFTLLGTDPASSPDPAVPQVSLPLSRPVPGQDPETIANRLGGFVPRPLNRGSKVAGTANPEGTDEVRIVGDAYWGKPQNDDILLDGMPN